ncbi:hypothetical protein E3U96_05685 [Streptococcus pseudopneumoniae]|nr:hypothetical protein [Streptococcus pseudopneumoniae]NIB85990.1 hypothetical protein [Streptococcus pseudopneumoniae]NIB89759.1 hypothetical protein [Streptococcus pseudopneumoniae]NIB91752.1 hypothetical protein [Streptococcus pseudopneumoniae]NIB95112.1 hypothetical protein [Streptococcus pseudopneumoniae]
MSCYNFDKFSISLFFKIFHPNLELSSKHLELQKLHYKRVSIAKTLTLFFYTSLSSTFYNTSSPK